MNDNDIQPCEQKPLDLFQELPRFDLREQAFRNYERYIVRAYSEGSYVLNPREERLKFSARFISSRSWVTRFRDAILGFMRYGYSCDAIPPGSNLMHIKAKELEHGLVKVLNLKLEHSRLASALNASNKDAILAVLKQYHQAMLDRSDLSIIIEPRITLVSYNTQEEKQWLSDLVEEHSQMISFNTPGFAKITENV